VFLHRHVQLSLRVIFSHSRWTKSSRSGHGQLAPVPDNVLTGTSTQVTGYVTNSLLKNSFGSSFRGPPRHGISLFVGFWRGGILYSVRDGVFRSLFQQTANQDLRQLTVFFVRPGWGWAKLGGS
jgi:hypothetical protein